METELMVSKKSMAIAIAALSAFLLVGIGATKYEQYKDKLTYNKVVNTREYNAQQVKRVIR